MEGRVRGIWGFACAVEAQKGGFAFVVQGSAQVTDTCIGGAAEQGGM